MLDINVARCLSEKYDLPFYLMKRISINNIIVPILTFIYLFTLPVVLLIISEYIFYIYRGEWGRILHMSIVDDVVLFGGWLLLTWIVMVVNKRWYTK